MRILIADDDLVSRTLLVAMLKKAGHEILENSDGTAAWEDLQKPDAPRLVILDWMMPGMDGIDVVRRVRALKQEQQPYIIMLTAKGGKADIVAGLDAGANDYLVKPFDTCELLARIEVGSRMIEMQEALSAKINELSRALCEIKTLRGILPICSSCKKIRDDQGYWNQVEVYVRNHTEASFSHGLCPECIRRLYPEFANGVIGKGYKDKDRCP